MAQIKGVINQVHRNHHLEQIKELYHSHNTSIVAEKDNEKDEINNENSDEDSESEFDELISINKNESNFERTINLWNQMLKDEALDDELEDSENEEDLYDME